MIKTFILTFVLAGSLFLAGCFDKVPDWAVEAGIEAGRVIAAEYEDDYREVKQGILATLDYIEDKFLFQVEEELWPEASRYILVGELQDRGLSPDVVEGVVNELYGEDETILKYPLATEPTRVDVYLEQVAKTLQEQADEEDSQREE